MILGATYYTCGAFRLEPDRTRPRGFCSLWRRIAQPPSAYELIAAGLTPTDLGELATVCQFDGTEAEVAPDNSNPEGPQG